MAQTFKTAVSIVSGSAAAQAVAAKVDGDSSNRVTIDAGGKISWGSGSAAADTTLYRSAADVLTTDDAFEAASLGVSGEFTLPTADGSIGQVLQTNGSGIVSWATAAGGGVTDHGNLTGLGDDDHTQYLLADGTRSATSLDVIGNATVGDIVIDSGANITGHYTGWVKLGASNTSSLGIDRNSIQAFGSSSGTYNELDINAFGGNILLNRDGGNTKIGGLAPSEKLDVGGNIKLSGNIIVGGTVDGRDVAADGAKLDDLITVSDTAPSTPSSGDLWYDSSVQVLYIYYNDGSSSQWVEVLAGAGGGSSSYLTANLSGGYSIPGVILTQEASNQSITANTAYYQPFIVGEEITVSSIRLYVQTASGTSGAKLRLSIYESDADWVPGGLVLDAGEVACDSTGSKSI